MIPLFLPVHSPQQWSVYQNVQLGFSLAMKNRQLMHAVQTVSLLLILCEKYVATHRKSDLQSTQNISYNKLHLLLIII